MNDDEPCSIEDVTELPDRETPWAGLPRVPTSSLPGTLARLKVYAQRAADGTELHHPYDATENDPLAPRKWHALPDSEKKLVELCAYLKAVSEYVSPFFG